MLADTHCHLNFNIYEADRERVLARAWEAGLRRILVPGVNLTSSRSAIQLAESCPEVFAAVGVHPNDALSWREDTLSDLRELAAHPKVVAIGEIGLDYYRQHTPPEKQRRVFRAQLQLAAELDLPVIIHNRQSSADLLDILSGWYTALAAAHPRRAECPGVCHAAQSSDFVLRALSLNFYIGIAGPVTFPRANELQQMASAVPLDRLLIETDAPFLTPQAHRGKRNEPAYVRFVAEKIADLRELTFDAVASITTANADRLFDW